MPVPVGKQALTVVVPLRAESAVACASFVEARAATMRARFSGVESLHFARLALVEADASCGHPKTLLLFATTFDGPVETHLDELWRQAGEALEQVFAHAEGWGSPATRESFGRFVARHARAAAALFSAHGTLSVRQIRADAELKRALSRWLTERERELCPLPALEVARLAQSRSAPVVDEGAPAAAPVVASLASVLTFADWLGLASTYVRSLVHDVFDWLGALWNDTLASNRSKRGATPPAAALGGVRCFSHAAELKPGPFRRAALRFGLRVLAKLSHAATNVGKLGGIETVHAARWMLLEDGRLVFLADCAEGLDVALARWAERASGALGMIWSHTRGFPASLGFWVGGARDGSRLREWARDGELRTPLCYSAYPELGTLEVRENAEIRDLLSGALDESGARRLLSLVRD